MVGWYHRLNGHAFGWTPGVGDGQEGLACCCSWSHKESNTTERLISSDLKVVKLISVKVPQLEQTTQGCFEDAVCFCLSGM